MDFSKVSFRPTATQQHYLASLADRFQSESITSLMRCFLDECVKFRVGLQGERNPRVEGAVVHTAEPMTPDEASDTVGIIPSLLMLMQQESREQKHRIDALLQENALLLGYCQLLSTHTSLTFFAPPPSYAPFDPVAYISNSVGEMGKLADAVSQLRRL